VRGPAETVTPLNVWDVRLSGSASFDLPAGHNAAIVVLEGEVSVEGSGPVGEAVDGAPFHGRHGRLRRRDEARKVLVLSG
jgi:redox-sensitive bicupin YhaK (pirin superfamily)